MNRRFLCILTLIFFFTSGAIFSQSHFSTQSHRSSVNSFAAIENILGEESRIFSCGDDGFLIKWTEDGLGEHYQVTDLQIKMSARSPNGEDIAIYETDGGSIHQVSVWNWKNLNRKFAKRFSDPVTTISYSSKGTFVCVGTASVEGAYFLHSQSGNIISKISEKLGVVNFLKTSDSENSICVYSPQGTVSYYNFRNGQRKARFNTERDLEQPTLFNNNIFLAGVKGGYLHVVQAQTGQSIGNYPVGNAVLLSSKSDKDLYFITKAGNARTYTLNVIKNDRNKFVIAPQVVKTLTFSNLKVEFVSGVKNKSTVYLGTKDGNVYSFAADIVAQDGYALEGEMPESQKNETILPLTDNMYDYISDIDSTGSSNEFYFLTANALYKSAYDNGVVEKKGTNPGYTNILVYGGNAILWSKETRRAVQILDIATGALSVLFTPENNIQVLRLFADNLISIEGNSSVYRFNISEKKRENLYKGTGLQDAVLFSENELYVAKTSSTAPQSSLLYVDCKTKETVPMTHPKADVIYSLCFDSSVQNPQIYGIQIAADMSGKSNSTSIFSWNPSSKLAATVLKIGEEDTEAFANLSYPVLFTNIGKTQLRSYNMNTRRNFLYKRSASMPIKVVAGEERLVALNRDGSISWYNPDMNGVLADWYLTADGQWFEF